MKRGFYLLSLLGLLLLMNSCWLTEPAYPRPELWLCSINADGTGFRKIKEVDSNFGTTGFWDIYMTKDDRIIFYGEKLWISETDTIRVEQIVPDTLTLDNRSRLSQSSDGCRMYFAANKDIYQITYPEFVLTRITDAKDGRFLNPIVSSDDNTITYLRYRQLKGQKDYSMTVCYMLLDVSKFYELPQLGQYCHNVVHRLSDNRLYYNRLFFGTLSCDLNGDNVQLIGSYGYDTSPLFGLSHNERFLIVKGSKLWVYDLVIGNYIEISVLQGSRTNLICSLAKNSSILYYVSTANRLMRYDLDSNNESLIQLNYSKVSLDQATMIATNWSGDKIYFTCFVSVD